MDGKSRFSSVRSGAQHVASHAELSHLCGALVRCDVVFVGFPHCSAIYRQDNEWRYQPRGEEAGSGRRKAS